MRVLEKISESQQPFYLLSQHTSSKRENYFSISSLPVDCACNNEKKRATIIILSKILRKNNIKSGTTGDRSLNHSKIEVKQLLHAIKKSL